MEDYERIAKLEFALKEIIGLAQSASAPDTFKLEKSVALRDIREVAENALLGKPTDSEERFRRKYLLDYVVGIARKPD